MLLFQYAQLLVILYLHLNLIALAVSAVAFSKNEVQSLLPLVSEVVLYSHPANENVVDVHKSGVVI